MNLQHMLFSFNGRLRRLHFWLFAISVWVLSAVIGGFTIFPAIMTAAASGDPDQVMAVYTGPAALIYWIFCLLLIWPGLAVTIKRLHDRNKSGWFYLLLLVPLVNLWILVEIYFLDGTPGPNQYGPSPKGIGGPAIDPPSGGVVS